MKENDVYDVTARPPAGVTLQQQAGSLIMRCKENTAWGYVMLIMSGWILITVAAYSVKLEGVPITQYITVAVICATLAFFGATMLINITTLTVNDKEVVITRGPISISSTKRLPVDQIVGLLLKFSIGQKTGRATFVLCAELADVKTPIRLIRFGRNDDAARFYTEVLSKRLGVPTSEKRT